MKNEKQIGANETLYKEIVERLSEKSGIVQVTTYTKSTIYDHRHASIRFGKTV